MVSDFKCGRSRPQRRTNGSGNKSTTTNTPLEEPSTNNHATALPIISRSRKSLVPTEITEILNNKPTKTPQKKPSPQEECTEELDVQLRELLREKEIVSCTNSIVLCFILLT